jgi:hypothetical protein
MFTGALSVSTIPFSTVAAELHAALAEVQHTLTAMDMAEFHTTQLHGIQRIHTNTTTIHHGMIAPDAAMDVEVVAQEHLSSSSAADICAMKTAVSQN